MIVPLDTSETTLESKSCRSDYTIRRRLVFTGLFDSCVPCADALDMSKRVLKCALRVAAPTCVLLQILRGSYWSCSCDSSYCLTGPVRVPKLPSIRNPHPPRCCCRSCSLKCARSTHVESRKHGLAPRLVDVFAQDGEIKVQALLKVRKVQPLGSALAS